MSSGSSSALVSKEIPPQEDGPPVEENAKEPMGEIFARVRSKESLSSKPVMKDETVSEEAVAKTNSKKTVEAKASPWSSGKRGPSPKQEKLLPADDEDSLFQEDVRDERSKRSLSKKSAKQSSLDDPKKTPSFPENAMKSAKNAIKSAASSAGTSIMTSAAFSVGGSIMKAAASSAGGSIMKSAPAASSADGSIMKSAASSAGTSIMKSAASSVGGSIMKAATSSAGGSTSGKASGNTSGNKRKGNTAGPSAAKRQRKNTTQDEQSAAEDEEKPKTLQQKKPKASPPPTIVPFNLGCWVIFVDMLLDRLWFAKYFDEMQPGAGAVGREAVPRSVRPLLEQGAKVFAVYFGAAADAVERGVAEWLLNKAHCWRDGRLDRTSLYVKSRIGLCEDFAKKLYGRECFHH